jgi:dCMP deaminase
MFYLLSDENHDVTRASHMDLTEKLTRNDIDRQYLKMAIAEASYSDDPKRFLFPRSAVGVVIADRSGLLAASANVVPPGLAEGLRFESRDLAEADRYYFIEHAERAAIYKALLAGKEIRGATMYGTRFPCADCARAIIWCGIKRAVFSSGLTGEKQWLESQRSALQMMRLSGVKVRISLVD